MNIKILEIKTPLVAAPGSRRQGHLTRFSAGNVIGWAVVVPAAEREEKLAAGMTLPVETNFDRIENWETWEAGDGTSLQPLETLGDYLVHGKIWLVGETSAALVEAGVFAFDISTSELPQPPPADGGFVSFTLRGLSLWESVESEE